MPELRTIGGIIRKPNYIKYLVGLLLASILFVTIYELRHAITDSKQMYAAEINISGRQRMLSQHTALLMYLLATGKDKSMHAHFRARLIEATDLLERSHARLTHGDADMGLSGKLTPKLKSLYYKRPFEVDAMMRNYLAILKTFAQLPDKKLSPDHPVLHTARNIALHDLLPALNAVVKQYELESTLAMAHSNRKIDLLITGLILLAMLILLLLFLQIITMRRSKQELLLATKVINNAQEGIVITDANENIQWVNAAFTAITGYEANYVIGKTPRILKSGQHSPTFYKQLWASIHNTGTWQGEIWKRTADRKNLPTWQSIAAIKDNSGKVTHYTAVFTDISEQKKVEKNLRYQSHYDALTDLPNRALFLEHLDQSLVFAERKKIPMAVMLLDLDGFKIINDTLGHIVGDQLLQAVAKRLKTCIRESDMVARLGGDEFTVILPEISHEEDAVQVGEKIIASFDKPFRLTNKEVSITTSVGISIYPSDGKDMDTLIKHADAAMYHAKEAGKNKYQLCTREINNIACQRLALETALQHALAREEFEVHYQPQVNIMTGEITGSEALVRWRRPGHGLVSPADFIPLAEENGLIIPLGEWVLQQICVQIKAWRDAGLSAPRTGFNLSARQFQQNNIIGKIEHVLGKTGVDPALLSIEITESVAMNDEEKTISIMQAINEMGISISVNNFGTGYSSLNHLKRLPIQILKIDRSLVRDITHDHDNATVVAAIITMAKSLGLQLIAEGVETEEQCRFLLAHACNEAQGYLTGPPMTAAAFEQVLRDQNSWSLPECSPLPESLETRTSQMLEHDSSDAIGVPS